MPRYGKAILRGYGISEKPKKKGHPRGHPKGHPKPEEERKPLDLKQKRKKTEGHPRGHLRGHPKGHPNEKPLESEAEGHLRGHPRGHLRGHLRGHPKPWITENQKAVLSVLLHKRDRLTSYAEISRETGISFQSTRKAVRILVREGYISKPKQTRKGDFRGFSFGILEGREGHPKGHPKGHPNPSSSIKEKLLQTKIQELFPNLHRAGFREEHLQEVIRGWETLEIDLNLLPQKLEYAEFISKDNDPKVKKPLVYILVPLKNGTLNTPDGFKSRAEIALEESRRELERMEQVEEEREDNEFKIWLRKIGQKGRADLVKGSPFKQEGKLQEGFLRNHFRENVFQPLI